jgi:hypothetical protein
VRVLLYGDRDKVVGISYLAPPSRLERITKTGLDHKRRGQGIGTLEPSEKRHGDRCRLDKLLRVFDAIKLLEE